MWKGIPSEPSKKGGKRVRVSRRFWSTHFIGSRLWWDGVVEPIQWIGETLYQRTSSHVTPVTKDENRCSTLILFFPRFLIVRRVHLAGVRRKSNVVEDPYSRSRGVPGSMSCLLVIKSFCIDDG